LGLVFFFQKEGEALTEVLRMRVTNDAFELNGGGSSCNKMNPPIH